MCKLLEDMCDEIEVKTKLSAWIDAAKSIMRNFKVIRDIAVRGLEVPTEYEAAVLAAL